MSKGSSLRDMHREKSGLKAICTQLTRSRSCVLCSVMQTLFLAFDLGSISRFILPKLF